MTNNKPNLKIFSTVDIETISINGKQIPVLISHYNLNTPTDPKMVAVSSRIFEINHNYLKNREYEKGVIILFKQYFKYLTQNKIKLIFAHNLGGFDGNFITKYLYHYTKDPELVDLIIPRKLRS